MNIRNLALLLCFFFCSFNAWGDGKIDVETLISKLASTKEPDFKGAAAIMNSLERDAYDTVIDSLDEPDYAKREAAMNLLLASEANALSLIVSRLNAPVGSYEQRWRLGAIQKILFKKIEEKISAPPNIDGYVTYKSDSLMALYEEAPDVLIAALKNRLNETAAKEDIKEYQRTIHACIVLIDVSDEVIELISAETERSDGRRSVATDFVKSFFINLKQIENHGALDLSLSLARSDKPGHKKLGMKMLPHQFRSLANTRILKDGIEKLLSEDEPELQEIAKRAVQSDLSAAYNYTSLIELMSNLAPEKRGFVKNHLLLRFRSKTLYFEDGKWWDNQLPILSELLTQNDSDFLDLARAILPKFPLEKLLANPNVKESIFSSDPEIRKAALDILETAKN